MSAFMVEDKTINNVVNTLSALRNFDHVRREIKENGYDLDTTEGKELLANEMFRLNVAGVNARYGEGEAQEFRPLDFAYKTTLPVNPVQCFKSLSCFLYQCAEGDIYKDNGLYAMLDRVKADLAEYIVTNDPMYDKAIWG